MWSSGRTLGTLVAALALTATAVVGVTGSVSAQSGTSARPAGVDAAGTPVAPMPAKPRPRGEQRKRAFSGQNAVEARRTVEGEFPRFVREKAWADLADDPDVRLRGYLDSRLAVVEAEGRRAVVASELPLTVPTASGPAALDSDLVERGDRLVPEQPLSAYSVDEDATARLLAFDGSRVTVGPAGGNASRGVVSGESRIHASVARDTDLVVKPTPTGVQVGYVLRSDLASTTLRLKVGMRPGDRLAVTDPAARGPRRGPVGGAVVVRAGRPVVTVTPTIAFDADGRQLPVTVATRGDQLLIAVETSDAVMPVLVDPYVAEDQRFWITDPNQGDPARRLDFRGWRFAQSGGQFGNFQGQGGFGNGMYLFSNPGQNYLSGARAQWIFDAPFTFGFEAEGAHIFKADFGFTAHTVSNRGSCISQGLWNRQANRWENGIYRAGQLSDPYTPYVVFPPQGQIARGYLNCGPEGVPGQGGTYPTKVHCLSICDLQGGNPTLGSPGNQARLEILQGPGVPQTGGIVYQGSSLIFLSEQFPPKMAGNTAPVGWTDQPFSLTATATDYGLGVRRVAANAPGFAGSQTSGNCEGAGPPQGGNPGSQNTGDRNRRCPRDVSHSVQSTSLPEGNYNLTFSGIDVVDNFGLRPVPVKIDRTPPAVALAGSLWDRRGQTVPSGQYGLTVNATDGNPAGGQNDQRSGVRSIDVQLDGETIRSVVQECPQGSCPASTQLDVDTATLDGGSHRLVVQVMDQVGLVSTQEFAFQTTCCLAETATWGTGALLSSVFFSDVDGDGFDDAILQDVLGGVRVARSTGTAFTAPSQWLTDLGAGSLLGPLLFADLDADRDHDLVYRDLAGGVRAARSTGISFEPAATVATVPTNWPLIFGDLDGDGDDDLITVEPGSQTIKVALANDGALGVLTDSGTWPAGLSLDAHDVDGDALEDLVGRNDQTGEIRAAISDDTSFAASIPLGTWSPGGPVRFADVNGDALVDAVARDDTGNLLVREGDGFALGAQSTYGNFGVAYSWLLGDVSGDGRADAAGADLLGTLAAAPSRAPQPVEPSEAYVPPPDFPDDPSDDGFRATPAGGSAATTATIAARRGPKQLALAAQDDAELVNPIGPLSPQQAKPRRLAIYNALKTMGVSTIRMNAFWGNVRSNAPGLPYISGGTEATQFVGLSLLDDAVKTAREAQMNVYVTITGTADKGVGCRDDWMPPGSIGFGCRPDIPGLPIERPSGFQPDPADFAGLVRQVVTRLRPLGVRTFSLWNEPNLDTFLEIGNQFTIPGVEIEGKGAKQAALYGLLYEAGWDAGKAVCPDCRFYLGEFSELVLSGLNTERFLNRVTAASGSLRADGIAFHPYQHRSRPRVNPRNPGSQPPGTDPKGYVGIGQSKRIQNAIRVQAQRTTGSIRTPAGRKPPLYFTEFGYFNRPFSTLKKRDYFHTEATRAARLSAALDQAIDTAQAKMLVLYFGSELEPRTQRCVAELLAEDPALPDENLDRFWDSGLLGLGGLRTGMRCYGKTPTDDFSGQPVRQAACAVSDWAVRRLYPGATRCSTAG